MLSLLRGRCPFKVIMKEKPGKYRVLIRILADCRKRYILRMEVYARQKTKTVLQNQGSKSIVKRLATSLKDSGRNITTDECTSVELAEELYTDYVLTLVGTMQTKRKHIPEQFENDKRSGGFTPIHFHRSDTETRVTLVSYVTREKPKDPCITVYTA
ncbi:hypothetical protein ANN_28091 [Periplaneta americana]|uniref:PiggyBac transposable element-derived protein domain-containing protein n=1 Tax=Periplaneta americana TaxID=6978 RepID=A0ABQ8RV91_PERAM|nr:hypothetical protein ANN_28091 [Periplaneta americana]